MTTVKVEGGDELLRKLERIGLDVSQVLEAAAKAGAEVIVDGANPLAPAPKILAQTMERNRLRVEVAVGPPDEKWHWRFFETGVQSHEITGTPLAFVDEGKLYVVGGVRHPGMAARPFLRPAFDAGESRAVDAVGEKLRRTVER